MFDKSSSKHAKGVVALIVLAFGFGVIAITARYLSSYYTLFQQLYLSVGLAFIVSLFIFPRSLSIKRLKKLPKRDWYVILFRVIIGYALAASLYRQALILTKISNVTFIQSIPFAGVFGWILFKEKFSFTKLLLLLVAYFGVVLIAVKDYSSLNSIGLGEIFSLISAALFALSYLSRKWQSDILTNMEITQVILLVGTVILLAISLLKGEGLPSFSFNLLLFLSLFFTGLFNAINIFLINYGFRNVKAVLASNILTLESVFALILAIIFYQEFPNVKELIGGILILGSVIWMNRLR